MQTPTQLQREAVHQVQVSPFLACLKSMRPTPFFPFPSSVGPTNKEYSPSLKKTVCLTLLQLSLK